MTPHRERGSAAVEVAVTAPLLLLTALGAWYAASGVVAAIEAQEDLRREGLERIGAASAPAGAQLVAVRVERRATPLAGLPALRVAASTEVAGR